MRNRMRNHLAQIARDLDSSKVGLPLQLKLKAAELILDLVERNGSFGLFVILGWKRRWNGFLVKADSEQDIFSGRRISIRNIKPNEKRRYDISATLSFDGAVLIDGRGVIVSSGAIIEGVRPRVVADRVSPGSFSDLSEQYGFDTKVHARHLTAIASSYVFRGTTVFTVSEETGAFHIYERGRIVHRDR